MNGSNRIRGTMTKIDLIKELRLNICGWCMALALWVAPANDPEGVIIIEAVRGWARRASHYLVSQGKK